MGPFHSLVHFKVNGLYKQIVLLVDFELVVNHALGVNFWVVKTLYQLCSMSSVVVGDSGDTAGHRRQWSLLRDSEFFLITGVMALATLPIRVNKLTNK